MSAAKKSTRRETYVNRVVLFLDILGFGDIVVETAKDQGRLHAILDAIDEIKATGDEREFFESQQITQFSDSLVVSYEVTERSAIFSVLHVIGLMQVMLIERGMLARGAVTVGKLLHTSDYLIGPAMVEAYELESRRAKFPRVLVSNNVFASARANPAPHHHPDQEEKYARDFVKSDEDGLHFIDYVSWGGFSAIVGEPEFYPSYLQKVSEIIQKLIVSANPSILEKTLWLLRQYSQSRKLFANLPSGNNFRIENSEICDDISSLPTFQREAQAAKALVEKERLA